MGGTVKEADKYLFLFHYRDQACHSVYKITPPIWRWTDLKIFNRNCPQYLKNFKMYEQIYKVHLTQKPSKFCDIESQ